jgi:hypothetical protein
VLRFIGSPRWPCSWHASRAEGYYGAAMRIREAQTIKIEDQIIAQQK